MGVDAFELDVRLSRDGVPVVIHDPDLQRTCDRAGAVADLTVDELSRVDATCRFSADDGRWGAMRAGVSTLADILGRYPTMPVIVELKGSDPAVAHAAVDVVRSSGAAGRVCFGGFSLRTLRAARAYGAELPTGAATPEIRLALYGSWVRLPLPPHGYAAFQVPECSGSTRIVSARFIAAAHRAQVPVYVWTVNEEADVRRLIDWGADGVITDYPDRVLRVLRSV